MGSAGRKFPDRVRVATVMLALAGGMPVAQAATVYELQSDGSCLQTGSGPEYRNFDGTCNNLTPGAGDWGAAGIQLLRKGPVRYADGVSAVRESVVPEDGGGNKALPEVRDISNTVVAQSSTIPDANGVSSMLMQWGQFLDHDLDLTEVNPDDEMSIAIGADDPVFATIHPSGMPFSRSQYDPDTGEGTGTPRQQVNSITAFIDGSQIYGSDDATALSLRAPGGKLKMSDFDHGPLLHIEDGMFVSGDVRVNEQVGLTVMHTLFNREHNRLAEEIAEANPTFDDEKIYQEARKINIGQMQAITYNEFLPALLGSSAPGDYVGYDATTNPAIANEFSTAAYRFGHSTLSPELMRLDANGAEIAAGHLPLESAFFDPSLLIDPANGGIEPILRGLVSQNAQAVDPYLVDAVRNMLFPPPVDAQFDLAALNMQRGRDHGLGSYNDTRMAYGLDAVTWETASFLPDVRDLLMLVYDDIDDIDLWIGGLAEVHVDGGMLGELFAAIVADQFIRLRDGDRFWYENGMFEQVWMDYIEDSTLSAIIMRNTTMRKMQADAFHIAEPGVLALMAIGLAGLRKRRWLPAA